MMMAKSLRWPVMKMKISMSKKWIKKKKARTCLWRTRTCLWRRKKQEHVVEEWLGSQIDLQIITCIEAMNEQTNKVRLKTILCRKGRCCTCTCYNCIHLHIIPSCVLRLTWFCHLYNMIICAKTNAVCQVCCEYLMLCQTSLSLSFAFIEIVNKHYFVKPWLCITLLSLAMYYPILTG